MSFFLVLFIVGRFCRLHRRRCYCCHFQTFEITNKKTSLFFTDYEVWYEHQVIINDRGLWMVKLSIRFQSKSRERRNELVVGLFYGGHIGNLEWISGQIILWVSSWNFQRNLLVISSHSEYDMLKSLGFHWHSRWDLFSSQHSEIDTDNYLKAIEIELCSLFVSNAQCPLQFVRVCRVIWIFLHLFSFGM